MVKGNRTEWKEKYFTKLSNRLNDYDKCFIVCVDNVRSRQMQLIRQSLRGTAEIIMGKNTMIRRVINNNLEGRAILEKLLPCVSQNIGFVFTKGDLNEVRKLIEANRVAAPAKSGTIAPCDVTIPKQNTGLGPEKTNFFQALSIQTKITRGTIEILNDVNLIRKGDKVGQSEATLLAMLKIFPFTYGLVIRNVFDEGSVYSPEVLDITPEIVLGKFMAGARNVAAVSMAVNYPTAASVPHLLANAFKKMLAVSVASQYRFEQAEQVHEYLADPTKFSVASSATAGATAAAAKEEQPVEEEEESEDEMGLDIFG